MSGFSHDIAGGQGNLVVTALKSPNFVSGSSGWSVNKNGSAEFNNVVIRGGEIVSGTSLFYNGTPAAGNLIGSISAVGGTDTFGNAYLAGFTSYFNSGGTYFAVQMWSGLIDSYMAASYAGPYSQQVNISFTNAGNGVQIVGPWFLAESTGASGVTLAATGTGSVVINGLSGAGTKVFGQLTATSGTAASPSNIQTDTWHAMTLTNGWAAGSGVPPQYRLTAWNEVEVIGSLNGASETSATFFTLPTGYRPTHTQIFPLQSSTITASGMYYGQASSTGALQLVGGTLTNQYNFHGFISLDA